jgi:predicted ATPase
VCTTATTTGEGMHIEAIGIQSYRSLYDIELRPRPFQVIVGANNAGKTNLLDAIHFIGEVHRHGVDIAVSRKGGFENIAYRLLRRTKRPIGFSVTATFSAAERRRVVRRANRPRPAPGGRPRPRRAAVPVRVRHSFSLRADSQAIDADFYIAAESLEIQTGLPDGQFRTVAQVDRAREELSFVVANEDTDERLFDDQQYVDSALVEPLNDESFRAFIQRNLRPTTLALSLMSFNEILEQFTQSLSETRLYQLAPIECRHPGVPTPSPELGLHGSNLPAVVDYLQKNQPDAWSEVLLAMRSVVPRLLDVKTEYTTDRRLALQFVEEGYGRPWSSEDISDGTIQSLALFSVLFDPRSSITLIEEPENSVHPWIIRNFASACRRVRAKQVLVTTHSPVLLDNVTPEEVEVAWRHDGRSLVAPMLELDPNAGELWSEGRNTVFELLDGGSLPQAVPGESL